MRCIKKLKSSLNTLFQIGKLNCNAVYFGTWVEKEEELSWDISTSCSGSKDKKSPYLLIPVWFPFDLFIEVIED